MHMSSCEITSDAHQFTMSQYTYTYPQQSSFAVAFPDDSAIPPSLRLTDDSYSETDREEEPSTEALKNTGRPISIRRAT